MQEATPAGMRLQSPAWSEWLDAFSWLIAVLGLMLCLRGQGKPGLWIAIALFVPVGRWLLSGIFRQRARTTVQKMWQSLKDFCPGQSSLPWRPAFFLVVLPAGLLFLSNNRCLGIGDTWPVVPTTCSLVAEGNADLDEYLGDAPRGYHADGLGFDPDLPYCALRRGEHVYSRYPAGMVQFVLPWAVAARLVGADFHWGRFRERLEKWSAAWLAAASLGVFFLIVLHLTEPASALVATGLLAVGSTMFSTVAQALWQHGGVVWWSLFVLLIEFRHANHPWKGAGWLQGVACGLMLPCRPTAALFVLPFGFWVLLREPKRAVTAGFATLLTFLPWLVWYQRVYGSPLGPSTHQAVDFLWTTNIAGPLLGVLFSPARGAFVYQPWLILIFLLVLTRVQQAAPPGREPTGWPWFCAAVILANLTLICAWTQWWGGHCWGSRYLSETIPLGMLLCVRPIEWLCRLPAGRGILSGLTAASFLMQVPGVYLRATDWDNRVQINRHPDMVWSWSRPPFLDPWQR